ncbi:hypothetical protein VP03_31410 [Sinorhizobium meliloti]|uniref:hypothetical protein n=1 Tax=Rhizobium meliloti TaxID=382 RepID=UPI0006147AB3|nr:hypothetical protein [Sinorhizobium meliloti]KKA07888.1 hypothetical protein VP03_31410 [Sinorhizobium meliloti]
MSTFLKQLFAFGLAAVILQLPQHAALAADPCKGVDTKLSATRKADYSRLVANGLDQKVQPSKISIINFMQAGTWTIVYADVPVADPGYFFFDSSSGNPVLKEVWGGIAEKSDEPEIAKWARDLGANVSLRAEPPCFIEELRLFS